uniref:toll-like receptor 1 isoform X1 n=2 Tax=Myxine glutinosa TaxID=7769 RepID=UPI00358F0AC3
MSADLLLRIVFLVLLMWRTSGKTSKANCHISHDDLTADCSKLRLSSVPEGLPTGLQRLDLSHNLLEEIPAGSFRAYGRLRVLLLASNKIKYFHPKVFIDTPHLQELDVHDNKLSAIPDKALKPLVHLLHLDISRNVYNSFYLGRGMRALTQLRYLEIGSPNSVTLQSQDLLNIAKAPLQELRLNSGGPLRKYSSGALAPFHGLQRFASSFFVDHRPQMLPNILNDLANTPMKELRMSNLFHFMQRNISIDYFKGLASCKYLRNFTIVHFMLTEVLVENIIKNVYLSSITHFNIIKSSYSNDRPVIFQGVPGVNRTSPLRQFTLDTILHIKFSNPKFLVNFTLFPDFSHVKISGTTMNSLMCYLLLVRRLKIVDFSGNLLNGKGFWRKECNFSVIFPDTTHLILSHNKFSDLDLVSRRLHLLPSLHYVDLSYNAISEFSFCKWPTILHSLILSHNDASLSGPICLSPHLRILDMSYTLLKTLDNSFLSRVPAIQELYLQGNNIKLISPELTSSSLSKLNIQNNSVSVVFEGSFRGIKNLCSLELGHNPYFCNCDLYWFRTTFKKNVLVDWPDMYRCSYPDYLAGGKVEAFHPHLVQCDTRVLIAVTTLVTGITGALIVGLGYYFDAIWFIRMGWLWIWAKRRGYKKLESNGTFRYHAFISYSENDSSWVNDCLVPTLESLESGLRLCIHDRDFTPGEWIVDNIIQCIEQSSKTIFVLSRNFVNSEWCNYELYFAHHRTMSEREDSLVLLLLEPLPTSSVPHKFCKLRSLLGKKTYLAWPSEESKRAIFWRNLVALLNANMGSAMENAA